MAHTDSITLASPSSFARNTGGAQKKTRAVGPVAALLFWAARSATRHSLRNLDDHMLADIGLTRAQADFESAKPFWRD